MSVVTLYHNLKAVLHYLLLPLRIIFVDFTSSRF